MRPRLSWTDDNIAISTVRNAVQDRWAAAVRVLGRTLEIHRLNPNRYGASDSRPLVDLLVETWRRDRSSFVRASIAHAVGQSAESARLFPDDDPLPPIYLLADFRTLVPGRLYLLDDVSGIVSDTSLAPWRDEIVIDTADGKTVRRFPRRSVSLESLGADDPAHESIVRALRAAPSFSVGSSTGGWTRRAILVSPPLPSGKYRFRVVARRRSDDGAQLRIASPAQEVVVGRYLGGDR